MAKTITAAANKNRQKQSFMIFPPSSSSQNHDKTKAKPIASNRSPFIKPPGFFPLPGIDLREAGQRGDVSCDEYRVSGSLGKRLIVNPLAAILLIARRLATIDPTHLTIDAPSVLMVLEISGLMLYMIGFLLMAWALITIGSNYQLGGSAPRFEDKMVVSGPYRLVRHPMYTAALTISFGLTCLTQSWAFLCVFCVYLVLILLLIPMEEDGLRKSYGGESYRTYRQKTRKLIPLIY
jgi:protein-S-isoprenylcysteine O-methyltransferase Ste14